MRTGPVIALVGDARNQGVGAGLLGCILWVVYFIAAPSLSGTAIAAGPCVSGGVCCVGNVCGTLDQFTHNAELACLQSGALENTSAAESIRAAGDCFAAKIMVSRVQAAIQAHQRAIEAQRKLRNELESHPDTLEFQFRALVPKIEKFNSAVPGVIGQLTVIEHRYRTISAKMADYLTRKRQLAGSSDYRIAAARNEISVTLLQGPNAIDQVHFREQSIQQDFQNNVVPLGQRIIDLEHLCASYVDSAENSGPGELHSICNRNTDLISAFHSKFDELSNRLAQSESTYRAELKHQQQIIDASSRIP